MPPRAAQDTEGCRDRIETLSSANARGPWERTPGALVRRDLVSTSALGGGRRTRRAAARQRNGRVRAPCRALSRFVIVTLVSPITTVREFFDT